MTITFSAGNAGTDANGDGVIDPDSTGSPATAKNVITVGASENDRQGDYACDTFLNSCASGQNHIFAYGAAWPGDYPANPIAGDPSAGNAEQMAAFSSRGPTDDGRIKPDVVAPGTWVLSGYSDMFQAGYDPNPNPRNGFFQIEGWGSPQSQVHKYFGGTSMANPLTAGFAAVVRQFYRQVFGHGASAALVKASIINTAEDMLDENNDGVDDNALPIPNHHEGWGRVSLAPVSPDRMGFVDETISLSTGQTVAFSATLSSGGDQAKVTLVWSDRPSTAAAGKNLVNDIDLRVTSPSGAVYLGNVFSGGWSITGGSPDRTNNVENVYIAATEAGTWRAEVIGFNVPSGPQPFALVFTR